MMALIDLDPLPYSYGGMTFEDGSLWPDSMVKKKLDDKIKNIVERSGADDWIGYLSDSPSNFRNNVATILPYKGNRVGNKKPPKHQMLRDYLQEAYPDQVTMIYGMEADDALSIEQWVDYNSCLAQRDYDWMYTPHKFNSEIRTYLSTIICTIDKDLEMVPGWHYKWAKGKTEETPPFFLTETEGLRFFYKQLLTGDSVDNIKGLYGISGKSKLLPKLDEMNTEQDMFLHVQEQYFKRFGSYADQFLLENGKLLWMLRDKDTMWEFPTITETNEEEDDLSF